MRKLTKQMQEEIEMCNELIEKMWSLGFKCYITKGTGHSEVIRSDKSVVLDIASPNFKRNSQRALDIVRQMYINEQLKNKKKELAI